MKPLLSNDYLVLMARVFIGFVFIIASVDKVSQPDAFVVSIANYKLVPEGIDILLATVLPWVELFCGLGVFLGVYFRGSSLLASLLSIIFAIAVFSALVRGLDIACGCFSQDPDVGKINWQKLGENAGLVVFSLFLFYSTSDRFMLERSIRKSKTDNPA